MRSQLLLIAVVTTAFACGSASREPGESVDAAATEGIVDGATGGPAGDPDPTGPDASAASDDASVDSATCAGNTVDACGPTCQRCPADDRQVATCEGGVCGVVCRDGLTCSDGSCARLRWDFEDGDVGGLELAPSRFSLSVRDVGGSKRLAVPADPIYYFDITLPVCRSGVVDLTSRALHLWILLDDGTMAPPGHYYLQAWVPSIHRDADAGERLPGTGVWSPFTYFLRESRRSSATNQVTLSIGPLSGRTFHGTIYLDDIRMEPSR